jgi:hypothetical protein
MITGRVGHLLFALWRALGGRKVVARAHTGSAKDWRHPSGKAGLSNLLPYSTAYKDIKVLNGVLDSAHFSSCACP